LDLANFSVFLQIFQTKRLKSELVFILIFAFHNSFFNQIKKEVIMTIVKRNGNLQNHFPTLFDDFLNRDIFNWGLSNFSDTNTTIPAVNIKETSDNYEVEVAAPGMAKKDFRVVLEGNNLTISSEKETQKERNEDVRYTSKEFSYQSFSRTFTLQKDVVDTEKIQAKYEDGVLHLLIPKMEHAKQKQPRLIEIL
jgi:HSP20 family protein